MGNLFVIIACVFVGVPLSIQGQCRRFFMVLVAVLLFAYAGAAYAAGIPKTAEEHRAMAQSYRTKAMNYERDAKTRQLVCEEYRFESSIPENPQSAGLSMMGAQKRCERYVRNTTDLAESARGLAEYHAAQAKALNGR